VADDLLLCERAAAAVSHGFEGQMHMRSPNPGAMLKWSSDRRLSVACLIKHYLTARDRETIRDGMSGDREREREVGVSRTRKVTIQMIVVQVFGFRFALLSATRPTRSTRTLSLSDRCLCALSDSKYAFKHKVHHDLILAFLNGKQFLVRCRD
jgi:hypothetical protein